jgi:CO dehydrogenase maturation factor
VELLLNHLLDEAGEYVIVDMTAGADSFASGLFTRFDLTVLVAEPTVRAVSVHRQYRSYAADFDVPILVVGNKVEGPADEKFLRESVGDDLLASFRPVGARARHGEGRILPLDGLEEPNRRVLRAIRTALDGRQRDWARSHELAVQFHRRNAVAWANAVIGEDVAAQIDPDFVPDPRLVSLP